MHAWLSVGHLAGVAAWGLGLSLCVALQARRPAFARRAYWGLTAPGLYLTILSGVWMLHQDPAQLKSPWLLAKLALFGLIFALDGYVTWGLRRRRLDPRLAGAAGALLLGALITLGLQAGGAP